MAKWIGSAAIAGLMVAIFWFVMTFVFFTAEPQGPWWALYLILQMITCPAWFLGFFFPPLVPILNAAIYALVALLICKLRGSSRHVSQHDIA
jgi:hypothetical protein